MRATLGLTVSQRRTAGRRRRPRCRAGRRAARPARAPRARRGRSCRSRRRPHVRRRRGRRRCRAACRRCHDGGFVDAESLAEALAGDRHQARPIAMVGAEGAQVEVDVLVEAGAGQLEASDRLEVAGEQGLDDAALANGSQGFGDAGQDAQVGQQRSRAASSSRGRPREMRAGGRGPSLRRGRRR